MNRFYVARVAVLILACTWGIDEPTIANGDATLTILNMSVPQDGTNFDFVVEGPGFTIVTEPEEQGCFHNPVSNPVLTGDFFTDNGMTNTLCHETCRQMGFLFAGTQDGDGCYCGSTSFDLGGPSTQCTSTCFGNPFEICGGEQEMTVWTTGGVVVSVPESFTLDDEPGQSDAVNQSITFDSLPAGDYTITEENLPSGWSLVDIDCGAAPHTRNGDSVTVTLADAVNVTCTFTNRCSGGIGGRATGDISGDGSVNLDDVSAFVTVLLDPGAATADDSCAADANGDTHVNGLDVESFIDLVLTP